MAYENVTGDAGCDEAWRAKPPELPSPRPFVLPKIATYQLSNGLTVQLVEDHRVPFVTAALGIRAGSCLEPADVNGVASLTAEMLTEGTVSANSKQIADEIDFIGGNLSGGADQDFTLVSASALSQYTERLFELMADVVLKPSFPEDELALKRTNLIQELINKRSQPDFLVEERFLKVVFGSHPYSIIAPTPESVRKIETAALKQYHARHYLPNEAVLIVVGDVKPDRLKPIIEGAFGAAKWQGGTMPAAKYKQPPVLKGRRVYLVDRPGSVQSSIKVGNLAVRRDDPDLFPLAVANQILGGAAHSRLFLNLREKKGYTYGAYSSFSARKDSGHFAAETDVRSEVTRQSLTELLQELARIGESRVSDQELKDAKSYITGSFQLALETQAGLAYRLLDVQLYGLPADYLETYADKIMAVTSEDVERVARQHIESDDLAIVVVGDGDKVKSELELIAPVSLYDTQGQATGAESSVEKAKAPAIQ